METTTEASPSNRELTPTEIKIAIAQIEDRLMRVAKAQSELVKICESYNEEEYDEDKIKANLRKKYDIPESVYLFFEGIDAALTKDNANICKPHLAAFVKGKLTERGMFDLLMYFEECAECDYGWVMIERPMGFYDAELDNEIDDITSEIKSIGTRSRAKNVKLPRIAGVWSAG
jgi:hypothetical protein